MGENDFNEKKELTLVTEYFDLQKRGGGHGHGRMQNKEYLEHGKFICNMPFPLIIYCDPEFQEIISEYRKDSKYETTIIPFTIEEFPHYKHIDKIRENIHKNPFNRSNPLKFSPEYIVTILGKYYVIEDSVKYVKTSKLGWIDFGIGHFVNRNRYELAFTNITEKVKIMTTRGIYSTCIDENSPDNFWSFCTAACFFGSVENMKDYAIKVQEKFVEKLLNHNMVLTDEQAMTIAAYKNTSNYEWCYGDYVSMLENVTIIQNKEHVIKILGWTYYHGGDYENMYRISKLMYETYENIRNEPETLNYVLKSYFTACRHNGNTDELKKIVSDYKDFVEKGTISDADVNIMNYSS